MTFDHDPAGAVFYDESRNLGARIRADRSVVEEGARVVELEDIDRPQLSQRILAGEVVFFIGAGFSIDSEGNSSARMISAIEPPTKNMIRLKIRYSVPMSL